MRRRRPVPRRGESWRAAGLALPATPKVEMADDFVSLVQRGPVRVTYRRGRVRVIS